jgi:site-specific recombinase XerD
MKTLRTHLAEYLKMRQALGFKPQRDQWLLSSFITFMEVNHRRLITIDLALDWAKQPVGAHPGWWAKKLSTVRVFARHMHLIDCRHAIPPRHLLPESTPRSTPVLYSSQDVSKLLHAAAKLASPFRSLTHQTLIGLLAVTGMRVGEAIRLDSNDVDWKHELIVIRHAKFRKSREVVLHASVMRALKRYASEREQFHGKARSPAFFVSLTGTRLIYNNVHHTFADLVRRTGIGRERARLHDLRHTFAVQTLLRWYREGLDVNAWLPRLSTYLGHADPTSTYWYLTASPELMALVGHKLECALGALP